MVTGPQRRRDEMSDVYRNGQKLSELGALVDAISSIKNEFYHGKLASIAKSLESIDQSLAIIAAAQTKLEEK
tara:strand:- start:457 stop:672 length:216 start_codon:yes stop_codon:yes gene_type:complete